MLIELFGLSAYLITQKQLAKLKGKVALLKTQLQSHTVDKT